MKLVSSRLHVGSVGWLFGLNNIAWFSFVLCLLQVVCLVACYDDDEWDGKWFRISFDADSHYFVVLQIRYGGFCEVTLHLFREMVLMFRVRLTEPFQMENLV